MSRLDAKARCGLILAGGEVVRRTLLEQGVERALHAVPAERVVAALVVAHKRYCARTLTNLPAVCPVVQPQDRGTAPAILYGLLRLTAMLARGDFHRAR
jgi:mannose-1-phosphate guanylyltransferase